jgi:hypothetical protein
LTQGDETLQPRHARKQFGKVDPSNPKTQIVETHNTTTSAVGVYISAQYKAGTELPFMVVHTRASQRL